MAKKDIENKYDNFGGRAANRKEGPLWRFTDNKDGSFIAPDAEYISRLYFPLMNEKGLKSSVTPELKGDICSGYDKYLTIATVTEDLHRTVNNRNFWILPKGKMPWSAAGNSTFQKCQKWTNESEYSEVFGRIGAFSVKRHNDELEVLSEITLFVPATEDMVELMKVEIKNTGDKELSFIPFSAMPLFGRHADNIRDHRQVTTMFQRTQILKDGVCVFPSIVHDEKGHTVNHTKYISLGFTGSGDSPASIWGDLYEFIGQGGSLDNPQAIFQNMTSTSHQGDIIEGKEAICALRFEEVTLAAGQTVEYILLNGITENEQEIDQWRRKYSSIALMNQSLYQTLDHWQKLANYVHVNTANEDFDNWLRWISFQLKCRQIFGNSYLPDFGYGRGGRGWRDLWQDLLSIFLVDPESAREEMINNFYGVRMDGSNATIIGTNPGEFIADRNNVPRTWSDHGAWPIFVLNFYIQQTGDYDILFKELTYWKDVFTHRNKQRDDRWTEGYGHHQMTGNNEIYKGSIFEHVLFQQLSAFYNVGEHNILLLEGADWNDTLDMARERGESVCFYNFYGHNLSLLADLLEDLSSRGIESIELLAEILPLLDRLPGQKIVDYTNHLAKQAILKTYFDSICHKVSGQKEKISVKNLITDLRTKSESVFELIREQEWIQTKYGEQFFNGHYDNDGQRVHGDHELGVRMDLASQVIPTMCHVSNNEQITSIYKAANRYLKDTESKGLRLCTDYKELKLNLGRVTGFVYGHKEHGSKWMQQNIMFGYGLYKRGFVDEGFRVFNDIFDLCMDSAVAQIFPGIPSYFETGDHGRYMYLTASPAWLLLSVVTQIFGIRGEKGLLCLHPNLVKEQFTNTNQVKITTRFKNKPIQITYSNPHSLNWNEYKIQKILLNDRDITSGFVIENRKAICKPQTFELFETKKMNIVDVVLSTL